MKYWFKKYPDILREEVQALYSDENYDQKFCFRNNLLVSCGEIKLRLNGQKERIPILIIYHSNTPYILPLIYILKEIPDDSLIKQISNSQIGEIHSLIRDHIDFKYFRHQGDDGKLCLLESDNLENFGIEYFSIRQIIKRIIEWLVGLKLKKLSNDTPEIDLFYHFKNKNIIYYFLFPQLFNDELFFDGQYIMGKLYGINKELLGYEKEIYLGAYIDGCSKAGIYLNPKENEININLLPNNIKSFFDLHTKTNILKGYIIDEKIIKGYWWNVENEPRFFKDINELIEIIGNNDISYGIKRISKYLYEDVKSFNEKIFIGLRYKNYRDEYEWQFFLLVKKKDYSPIIGEFTDLQFSKALNNYEVQIIQSEPFNDKTYHLRNNNLSIREKLSSKKINIIGCGALGGEIADILSKAGIGTFKLIDKDIVKAGNPIRHLASLNYIGFPKTLVVNIICKLHNPFINIEEYVADISNHYILDYINNDTISISTIADDNIEAMINEQAIENNMTIFYSRALRGGKYARIFRVIPGIDACFHCLTLYKQENNKKYIVIPPDEFNQTLYNECNNPIRPASAAELKLISSITSKILLSHLQYGKSKENHWIWSTEKIDTLKYDEKEPYKLFSDFIPINPKCIFCNDSRILNVKIEKSLQDFMIEEIKLNSKIETGGVLAGYRDNTNSIIIKNISGPGPDSIKKEAYFQKDIEYCQKFLDDLYIESGKKIVYIGEWHYHPSTNNNPSEMDIESMQEISLQKEYVVETPILIILSKNYDLNCTAYPSKHKQYFVEAQII